MSYLDVVLLAALPAAGNFLGGLVAEVVPLSRRTSSLALHAAAGVVIGVVAVEIVPRALATGPVWLMALAFTVGGVLFILADSLIGIFRRFRGGEGSTGGGPWLIYVAVTVDLLSDGLMIGGGATVAARLGWLLALAQVLADVPEGFATLAVFRRLGLGRAARLALAASFALPVEIGATVGYFAVRDASDAARIAFLVLTAGMLVTVTVEEMMPEAHEEADTRIGTMAFVVGFAAFMLVSHYLT